MHSARAERRAGISAERHGFLVKLENVVNELCVGILSRICRVKPVDVRKKNEKLGTNAFSNQRRKGIVVTDLDLLGGDRVVFVDDRDHVKLEKAIERAFKILVSFFVLEVVGSQKKLSNRVVVARKELVVDVHQLALTDRCRRLLGGDITGACGEHKLAHSHSDRTRGNEDYLVTCVFKIAEDLAEYLHQSYVESARRVSEGRRTYFYNDFHNSSASKLSILLG